ncbi:MAG: hypothetical protein ACJ74Z_16160 [Bryobacteraceae bacterium]
MERNHTPYEASEVECKDCFSYVVDADEEFCEKCGGPLCLDCQTVVNDEPLCEKCLLVLSESALESLRNDPEIGDLFQVAA